MHKRNTIFFFINSFLYISISIKKKKKTILNQERKMHKWNTIYKQNQI